MARSRKSAARQLAAATLVAAALTTTALVAAQDTKTVEVTVQQKTTTTEVKKVEATRPEPAAAKKDAPPAAVDAVISTFQIVAGKGQPAQKAAKTVEGKAAQKVAVEVVMEKAALAAAPAAAPGAADPNVVAFADQCIAQYRPLLRAELRMLSSAAEPDPTQRRAIAVEGSRTVRDISQRQAENQFGVNNGIGRVNNRRVAVANQATREPRAQIHEAVSACAKKALSPDQFARYQKEVEARTQEERRAMVTNVVANIDRILYLSTEQRAKLVESLLSQWDDRVYPSMDILVMYDAYFPMIPDKQVNPILNPAQRTTWQAAQKINFAGMNFANFFNNGMMPAGPGDDEDTDEKAAFALVKEEKR